MNENNYWDVFYWDFWNKNHLYTDSIERSLSFIALIECEATYLNDSEIVKRFNQLNSKCKSIIDLAFYMRIKNENVINASIAQK